MEPPSPEQPARVQARRTTTANLIATFLTVLYDTRAAERNRACVSAVGTTTLHRTSAHGNRYKS